MKLTEKEFLDKMAARVAGTTCRHRQAEIARDILREAGLEFAPEPMKLPERLAMAGRRVVFDQNAPFDEQTATDNLVATAIVYGGASLHPASAFNERVVREMVARYNAYPGLRAAAETLSSRIRSNLAPGTQYYLAEEAAALEAELAKGPK